MSDKRSAGKAVLFLDRPISRPEDEQITPLDDFYLQYFLLINESRWPAFTFPIFAMKFRPVPTTRISLLLSSDILRPAALAWASFVMSKNSQHHAFQYLDRCYKRLSQALSGTISVDVGYAVYMLAMISIRTDDSTHLIGLGKVIECLQVQRNGLIDWELKRLLYLYYHALSCSALRLAFLSMGIGQIKTHVRQVCDSIPNMFPSILAISELRSRLKFLGIFQFYYSTYSLLLLNGVVDDRNVGQVTELSAIMSELHQITEIHAQSSVDDMHRLDIQSFSSMVFLRMLENCDRESPDIQQSALILYNIVALRRPESMVNIKALLLSGLILTKSRYPEGAIHNRILLKILERASIISLWEKYHWWREGPLKLLPLFLDKADTCSSFHEMFMLKVHDWTFWQLWVWLGTNHYWLETIF